MEVVVVVVVVVVLGTVNGVPVVAAVVVVVVEAGQGRFNAIAFLLPPMALPVELVPLLSLSLTKLA